MRSRDFIVIEVLFLLVISGSLAVSYNLYLYRYELERAVSRATTSTTADDYTRRVLQLVEDVKRDLSRIRGLNFTRDVEVVLINTTWALERWAPRNGVVPEDVLYRERVYRATLLTPYNFSIAAGQRQWVAMFLAATVGTTLYINTDYFSLEDRGARNVIAHELMHILQHLHFRVNLGRHSSDAVMAVSALIEGDAGWAQHLYCRDTGLCTPSPTVSMNLRNPYISLLLFPYIYGENFVKKLYTYGGWELVNSAYSKPPTSTSMVMRPEKYIAYLSNGSYAPEDVIIPRSYCNYRDPLHTDTLGEYYILLVLAQRIGLDGAEQAANGWSGDRVELYRDAGTRYLRWVVCWNTSWVSVEDAREFYQAFVKVLEREAEHISIYGNTTRGEIHIAEAVSVWEPGVERVHPLMVVTISLNGRYVAVVSEIIEPVHTCRSC